MNAPPADMALVLGRLDDLTALILARLVRICYATAAQMPWVQPQVWIQTRTAPEPKITMFLMQGIQNSVLKAIGGTLVSASRMLINLLKASILAHLKEGGINEY